MVASAFKEKRSFVMRTPYVPSVHSTAKLNRLANAASAQNNLNKRRVGAIPSFKHKITGIPMRHKKVKKPSPVQELRWALGGMGRLAGGVIKNVTGYTNPRVRRARNKHKAMMKAVNATITNATKALTAANAVREANKLAMVANENLVKASRTLQNASMENVKHNVPRSKIRKNQNPHRSPH